MVKEICQKQCMRILLLTGNGEVNNMDEEQVTESDKGFPQLETADHPGERRMSSEAREVMRSKVVHGRR